jgi:dihydrolipoamide dehydrogenase
MSQVEEYDAIIVGAGQGGMPLATLLAGKGWKVALIERKYLGGTCINFGCTPTKTMVASAEMAYLAGRAADYGVHIGEVKVNMEEVRQRKRGMVESFRQGNQRRIDNSKVDLMRGSASFSGPRTLDVKLNDGGSRQLGAKNIFIDTGGRPRQLDLPGMEDVPWLDSTSIMELDETPEHLLIIGGGYEGVEFGQMFRRFGSQVTIIQYDDQLLPREDEDIAECVAEILGQDGIEILLGAKSTRVEKEANQIRLQVEVRGENSPRSVNGTHLLIAVGRVPNTEDLQLETAGIATNEQGYILVNERLETSIGGVYAIGDVKGGPAFTHISYDDFRILRTNLLEGGKASTQDRLVPYVVFMDPQLGRIGLTETQAKAQGRNFRVAKMPMTYVSRAVEVDRARGLMKALVDANTDQILGCAILGEQGGEIMAILEVAMMGSVTYQRLREAIFTHPSLSESLNNLFTMFEEN